MEQFLVKATSNQSLNSVASSHSDSAQIAESSTFIPNSLIGNDDIAVVNSWLGEFANVPTTFRAYRKEATRFVHWAHKIRTKALRSLDRADIEAYRAFMTNPPENLVGPRNRPRLQGQWTPFEGAISPTSQRYALIVLGSLFRYLVDGGYAAANPIALIRRKGPRVAPNRTKTISKEDLDQFLTFLKVAADAQPVRYEKLERELFVCTWLFETGCRRDELANAVLGSIYSSKTAWRWTVYGKGETADWIPMRDGALIALNRYQPTWHNTPNKPILGSLTSKVECLRGDQVIDVVRSACERFGKDQNRPALFKNVTPHWFRHAITAHLLNEGTDPRYVQRFLRHKSMATTMAYDSTGDQRFESALAR